MSSFCTYGDIPLVLDTMEVDLFVNGTIVLKDLSSERVDTLLNDTIKNAFRNDGSIPLKDVRIINDNTPYPGGTYLLGMTQPFLWPKTPELRFGEFFYPNYASRWSQANFLITQDQYDEIMPLCFPTGDGTPTPQDFVMQQDDTNTITTSLYLLPPRPLAKYGTNPGLWLITLVDERYYWQYKNPGSLVIDDSTTWDSLIQTLASALDITLTVTPNPVYGQPQPLSDFYSDYENAAIMMDAALWNIGCVLVRDFDGTYSAKRNADSDTVIEDNIPDPLLVLGGGDSFKDALTDNNPNLSPNAILPAQVVVTFPKRLLTGDFVNSQTDHIPYPRTAGDVWAEYVTLADVGYGDFVGVTNTQMVFHDTAEAWQNTAMDSSPLNEMQCRALALQLAADFYANQLESLDYTLPSIIPWTPEGVNDLIFIWSRDHCYTRIQHKPWNFMAEEMMHHFLAPTSTSSMSSSAVSTSISSTSPSTSFSEFSLSSSSSTFSPSTSVSLSSFSSTSSSSSFTPTNTFVNSRAQCICVQVVVTNEYREIVSYATCVVTQTIQRLQTPLTSTAVCECFQTAFNINIGSPSKTFVTSNAVCLCTQTIQRLQTPLVSAAVCVCVQVAFNINIGSITKTFVTSNAVCLVTQTIQRLQTPLVSTAVCTCNQIVFDINTGVPNNTFVTSNAICLCTQTIQRLQSSIISRAWCECEQIAFYINVTPTNTYIQSNPVCLCTQTIQRLQSSVISESVCVCVQSMTSLNWTNSYQKITSAAQCIATQITQRLQQNIISSGQCICTQAMYAWIVPVWSNATCLCTQVAFHSNLPMTCISLVQEDCTILYLNVPTAWIQSAPCNN